MASSLADSATLAVDPAFIARVQGAFVVQGANVINSEPENPLDPSNLARRNLYANGVIDGMDTRVAAMAWTVAAQSDITSDSTDDDIAEKVTAFWSAVAGA